MPTSVPREYWPTTDWREATPQELGMDPVQLTQMQAYIERYLPGLHALLIVRHGSLAFEQYYQGFSQQSYHNLSSATKSVISALVGAPLTQGLLTSLDQPVFDFFPAYAAREQDPRKHAITLRHLLSLQTGYPKDSAIIWLFRSLADERGERKFAPAQLSSSISTNSLGFLRINSPISLSVVGAMVWNAALSWLMEVNNSASSSKSQGRGSRWCVAPC